MGRNKCKGRRRPDNWTSRSNALDMQNERFEKYYKAQGILADDEEWGTFMQALRKPLPSTFRIAGHRQMKTVLRESLKNTYIPELEKARYNDEPVPVPRLIPWYPEELAWHVGMPRKELRKSPEYKRFHSFLVYETEVGNISRQEAVSMIPPLFLDVRPHHRVIDLCAAPGSKTSQLLEAMDPPDGLLIANDSDHKRAHLLVHTTARLSTPALMVTNLDASIFPSIKSKDGLLRFNRILADVPCSGDGTIRKNIGIWKSWNPNEGNGLHTLQLRILQRAMRLLARDAADDKARIVYSTCSLNPVENEAVVAAALTTIPGFELVDVSEHLPDLIRRPGIMSWRPAVNKEVDMPYDTYAEYCESFEKPGGPEAKEQNRKRLVETHWPPANAGSLGLDRCMRIYPHLQDTGGFFVAVLQRKSSSKADQSESIKANTDRKRPALGAKENDGSISEGEEQRTAKKAKLSRDGVVDDVVNVAQEEFPLDPSEEVDADVACIRKTTQVHSGMVADASFKENPFTFLPEDDPNLVSCIERLHLSDTFPRSNIYVRNPRGDPVRSLYLVNDVVKAVMSQTDYTRIRLISAGVKLFGRSELARPKRDASEGSDQPKHQFRVLNEGLLTTLRYIDEGSFITADSRALSVLLKSYHPRCESFEEPFKSIIEAADIGSHVACFKEGNYGVTSLTHDLILPLWKSELSVSLMIDKKAKSALSLRLFGDDITFVGRQTQAANTSKESASDAIEVEDDTAQMEEDQLSLEKNES